MRIKSSCSDEEEFGRAGIALAARTAAKLIVDAPAFMALGADHIKAARGKCLLLVDRDFVANGLDLDLAFGGIGHRGQFVADAHVGIAAQLNVGAAARHVGGDGDGAGHAGLRHDEGFLLVIAGIQHMVGNALFLEQLGEMLGFLDRGGAHQHGLALFAAVLDQLDDRVVLLVGGAIDFVVVIDARHRAHWWECRGHRACRCP